MSIRSVFAGAAAGAVGTVALNVVTYLDMVVRARPASDVPAELVKKIAAENEIESLTGDDDAAKNRRSGGGALLGYANGLGIGAGYGLLRPALRGVPAPIAGVAVGALAMAFSDVPLIRAGLTDPKTWSTTDWLADAIPHAVYGLAVAIAFDAFAD